MVTEPNDPPIRFEENKVKIAENSIREKNNTTVHTLVLGEGERRL